MDAFAGIFEVIVLSLTGFSLASVVGFILWDTVEDRKALVRFSARQPRSPSPAGQVAGAAPVAANTAWVGAPKAA